MKKEKKNPWGLAITLFIVLSMVFSIFAVVMSNPEQKLKYGNYKFTVVQNGYMAKIGGESMLFQYYPSKLERINISEDVKSKLTNAKAIVLLFNPNMTDEELQYVDYVRFDIQTKVKKQFGFGVLSSSETYPLTILGCENATEELPFIVLNSSSDTGFFMDADNNNCVYMNARLRENIAAGERLIYTLNGVMS